MENLNAETVKKALEFCSNNDECVGEECPYYATSCEKNMPKDALALINSQEQRIKELTAKVAKWEEECDLRCDMWCKLNEENKRLTEEIEDLNAIAEQYRKQFEDAKADTVRKFAKRVKEAFNIDSEFKSFFGAETIFKIVAQIAKEITDEAGE